MKLRSIASMLALASTTGCALLAPVDEHASEGAIYYLGGPAPASPDSSGSGPAAESVDAGVATFDAGVAAFDAGGDAGENPDVVGADVAADAPRTCERAFDDAGAGPTCPTTSPARYACTFDWDNGAGCDYLGHSGGRWWVCC